MADQKAGFAIFAFCGYDNLLNDGVSQYAYDQSNRLKTVTQGLNTYTFVYNGLGDRLRQSINGVPTNYTLDLNAGLTQVLADGSNEYVWRSTLAQARP